MQILECGKNLVKKQNQESIRIGNFYVDAAFVTPCSVGKTIAEAELGFTYTGSRQEFLTFRG